MSSQRRHDRAADALRPVRFTRRYTAHAEGSVLVEFGATRVLCTASVEEGVPGFLRGLFDIMDRPSKKPEEETESN